MAANTHFHFLTLFPETITPWLTSSIIGRAHQAGIFDFEVLQLRDFSNDPHRRVDDFAYGGGGGMVLKVEPLVRAVEELRLQHPNLQVICFSPCGRRLNHDLVMEFAQRESEHNHYLLICGHYEGIDQRFIDNWVDIEISLGDFVLTGGELPALAFADALIRQIEGTITREAATSTESFALRDGEGRPLIEYPQFTRPSNFRGLTVPEILQTGDHARIATWRQQQSHARTKRLDSSPKK